MPVLAAALWGSPVPAAIAGPASDPTPPASASPGAEPILPAAVRLNRAQKLHELVGYLGYGVNTLHVDVAIPYLTANVAPADPNWNSSHPRWAAVSALIRRDLREDVHEGYTVLDAAAARSAEQAMMDDVLSEDLDAALAFFRSPTGQRFQDLQSDLIDLSIAVGLTTDSGTSGLSVEHFDTRKRVLDVWLPIVFVRAAYGTHFAERAVDGAYQKYSRLRGAQLDALAERYAPDLAQFEAFTESASFGRIMQAEKDAGQKVPAPDLSAFFASETSRHSAAWRAAYRGP